MTTALTAAPQVDAAIPPENRRLYEFHKRGPELTVQQVRFLNQVIP